MKLSVAVITYNQEHYIRQCLDGIVMQKTNFNFEVIIGEDCSTDGTISICREYADKYPNIRILSNNNNLGYAENWKRVLSACNGEYIAAIEGDDYWTNPNKLQKQVDFLDNNPEYGLCYTDCDIYYVENNTTEYSIIKNKKAYVDEIDPLKLKYYFCNVTWVFRNKRQIIPKIDSSCLDVPMVILYENYLQSKIGFVNMNSGVYRRHKGSISNNEHEKEYAYKHPLSYAILRYTYLKQLNKDYTREAIMSLVNNINLINEAYKYQDHIFIGKCEEIFNNFSSSEIMTIFSEIRTLQKTIEAIKDTKSYKLGSYITAPFRWIKKIIHQ